MMSGTNGCTLIMCWILDRNYPWNFNLCNIRKGLVRKDHTPVFWMALSSSDTGSVQVFWTFLLPDNVRIGSYFGKLISTESLSCQVLECFASLHSLLVVIPNTSWGVISFTVDRLVSFERENELGEILPLLTGKESNMRTRNSECSNNQTLEVNMFHNWFTPLSVKNCLSCATFTMTMNGIPNLWSWNKVSPPDATSMWTEELIAEEDDIPWQMKVII